MNFKNIAAVVSSILILTSISALAVEPASVPVTLKDGRTGMIVKGHLMLRRAGGKLAPAEAGRYTTHDGKLLWIGKQGQLNADTASKVKSVPQPEIKRETPTGTGRPHQTGTNL